MKRTFLSIIMLAVACISLSAANLSDMKWANICSGGMGADWYGTTESQDVADIVLAVQKNTGGWMKNDQLHNLSTSEYNKLINARDEHSCFDNYATTQEMRFLAKVWQGCKVDKYRESFEDALLLILKAQKQVGGWSQYYPLSGGGSYQDYITFNDDLMTNIMKILRDIYNNEGDFKDIVDETLRNKCKEAFDKGLECIIKCQVDDNGTPAAWCAQHDTIDYLPTEGRPHELPSISGYESASLLSFLMSVENPSEELQNTITTAIDWLSKHIYRKNAKIEDYTNTQGEADRHIVDATNSDVWARFIQIGGESGEKIYNKFFQKLQKYNRSRSYTYNGKTYTFTEYQIATSSYDATKEYQPIYAIYDSNYPHLYYRFLYNYEDADSITIAGSLKVPTSLCAVRRTSYQFLGSWCYNTIHTEYPAWKQKIDAQNEAGEATLYELSQTTYVDESPDYQYNFNNGFYVTNAKTKHYGTGTNPTCKYSANEYIIYIPEGISVTKVTYYGYNNYNTGDANISKFNGQTLSDDAYVFPAKDITGITPAKDTEGTAIYRSYTLTPDAPVTDQLKFSLKNKQCCLVISLYGVSTTGVKTVTTVDTKTGVVKRVENGTVVIEKNNKKYNVAGKQL
ncbi:MAG: pectate lyase [Prevotella sp.]|nr:pectate lyase [Prevotella sp.]